MKTSTKWILISIVLFILSTAIGWLIPDGLNWISQLLHRPTITISPTDRLFSFMLAFAFMTSIELIIWVRTEFHEMKSELPQLVRTTLERCTTSALDESLFQIFWKELKENPEVNSEIRKLLNLFMESIIPMISDPFFVAYSVIIEKLVRKTSSEIQTLRGGIYTVDVADHLEITRRLSQHCTRYIQIQRKAYLVPDDWTNEWMRFIDFLSTQPISCEYVVLMDKQSLKQNKEKLDSMNLFLTKRKVAFKCCDLTHVLDSLGGSLPMESIVESFDDKYVKTQDFKGDKYQGGIKVRVTLINLAQRSDVLQFINCVQKFAQKYDSSLLEEENGSGS
jgi:hypothetical protein